MRERKSLHVCMHVYVCIYVYADQFLFKSIRNHFFLTISGNYLWCISTRWKSWICGIFLCHSSAKILLTVSVISLFLFLQSLSSIINGNKCSQYLSSHIYLPEFISIPKTLLNSLSATTFNTIKYNECLLKLQKLGTQGLQHNDLSSLKPFIIYYKLRLHW